MSQFIHSFLCFHSFCADVTSSIPVFSFIFWLVHYLEYNEIDRHRINDTKNEKNGYTLTYEVKRSRLKDQEWSKRHLTQWEAQTRPGGYSFPFNWSRWHCFTIGGTLYFPHNASKICQPTFVHSTKYYHSCCSRKVSSVVTMMSLPPFLCSHLFSGSCILNVMKLIDIE